MFPGHQVSLSVPLTELGFGAVVQLPLSNKHRTSLGKFRAHPRKGTSSGVALTCLLFPNQGQSASATKGSTPPTNRKARFEAIGAVATYYSGRETRLQQTQAIR